MHIPTRYSLSAMKQTTATSFEKTKKKERKIKRTFVPTKRKWCNGVNLKYDMCCTALYVHRTPKCEMMNMLLCSAKKNI